MNKKITLYFPIELKARELSSFVLLSIFAVNHGCRIYLGSKSSIRRLLKQKKIKAGLYVFNGGVQLPDLLKIKSKTNQYVILDHEISPSCLDFEDAIRSRLWPDTQKYIDRYYVLGERSYNASFKVLDEIRPKIVKTGWPIIDLSKKEFHFLFSERVNKIKEKHGEFILFSSAFCYISKKMINDVSEVYKKSNWKSLNNRREEEISWAKLTLKEFQANIKIFKKIDKDKSCPQIIIRPHPSEDHDEWRRIASSFSKIKVIYEGEITPWIYASSALLHRGCASAVQAYMFGIPIGYPIFTKKTVKKALPYKISEHFYNSEEIIKFCKKYIGKKPETPKCYSQPFNDVIHIENKHASELIIEDMLKLHIEKEGYYKTKLKDFMYDYLKKKRDSFQKNIKQFLHFKNNIGIAPQSQKIPGGITKLEIEEFLDRLSPKNNLKVKHIFRDCIEIE